VRSFIRKYGLRITGIILVLSMAASFAGCNKKNADGVKFDENGVPYILEDFEGKKNIAIARGDTTKIEVIGESGDRALKISNRTDAWNGANFKGDSFIGNKVTVKVSAKSDNKTCTLSLQYDLAGTTAYTTIGSGNTSSGYFTNIVGEIEIPEHAENVFFYVEASGVEDIVIDNFSVTVSGEYRDPKTIAPLEYADISEYPELKTLYADYFKVGCAIPTTFVSNKNTAYIDLVTKEFNAITFENELKPDSILDYETSVSDLSKYNESPAVSFDHLKETLDYCKENGIAVRGHTLVWYSQTPAWLYHVDYDITKDFVSRDLMLKRMENYIKSVFEWAETEYPGVFYAWDVVNEAVADGGGVLRDCEWKQIIGDDYVEKAFEYARKYAPTGVKLFYNDYNSYQNTKRDTIIKVLTPIAKAGNIDGVGMQGHISTATGIDYFMEAMRMYADLGVVVNVTELDISMPSSKNADYDQGAYFNKLFKAFIDGKKEGIPLECVTVWGLCDNLSWKSAEKPLLFAEDLSPKTAFNGVVAAAKGEDLPKPADYVEVVRDTTAIYEDYEDGSFIGHPRFSSTVGVGDVDVYDGNKSLFCTGGVAEYDGYSIDISGFVGKKIHYSFAIKSEAPESKLTLEIDGSWPTVVSVATGSDEWLLIEGTYDVPDGYENLEAYFETTTMDSFSIDNVLIELAE